jgi:molybdopterin-binding protein
LSANNPAKEFFMNVVEGTISRIIRGRVNLVEIKAHGIFLKCVTLGLPPYAVEEARVKALFKETNTILCAQVPGSMAVDNILECTVVGIGKSEILAEIKLDFLGTELNVIVTVGACERAGFIPGMRLYALPGVSEISIMEG